jgi:hypothetical protein
MNALSCPVTRAEAAFAERMERTESLHTAALVLLANEFENAMKADRKDAKVSTPGFSHPTATVDFVVGDLFAGIDGDDALRELLSMVSAASKGETVMHRAQGWIAARAGEHAEFHCADLVENWSEA